MSNFVTIEEDKFTKRTTYKTAMRLSLEGFASSYLNYKRIIVMPDHDVLYIDLEDSSCTKIIMLIDGDTVVIENEYHSPEIYDNRKSTGKYVYGSWESHDNTYLLIDKDLLKRICDCKSFNMKIYSFSSGNEVKNVNAFIVFSKLFYNAVYDNTAYTDVVTNALAEFTRPNSDLSHFSKIALDGSNADGSMMEGCMGVFVLLISLTATAIGGICALL